MMTNTNTALDELRKAFALATRCSEREDTSQRERNEFRAIAHLIWKSCGTPSKWKESYEIAR